MSRIDVAPELSELMLTQASVPQRNKVSDGSNYVLIKRAFDIALSSLALALLLPLLLVLYVAVRLDGGPALFGHVRIGRHGRSFPCLKFRSMVPESDKVLARLLAEDPDAATQWAHSRKLTRDPRITKLGRILRSTSLDELPQLINVLRGDMSLVGPRPVVSDELDRHYSSHSEAYLSVRPGITGLWQASGRSNTSYEARVAMDCQYVAQMSFRNDLTIMLRTVPAVLKRTGAQ